MWAIYSVAAAKCALSFQTTSIPAWQDKDSRLFDQMIAGMIASIKEEITCKKHPLLAPSVTKLQFHEELAGI